MVSGAPGCSPEIFELVWGYTSMDKYCNINKHYRNKELVLL